MGSQRCLTLNLAFRGLQVIAMTVSIQTEQIIATCIGSHHFGVDFVSSVRLGHTSQRLTVFQ
jgi:hypothetical protein